MLVLTRRTGESVRIGDEVTVTILDIRGDVVRVGIQAPRSVTVHRDEVYRELRKANEAAARTADQGAALLTDALRKRGQAPTSGPVPAPPVPPAPPAGPPTPRAPIPRPPAQPPQV
ncbi:carbon storage regulator CsrA [Actinokineospora diospyrosa]|uniref:Translational regulator CsrA n=1 Tax=Actinokineospora diospyrosa TaxID=103728 RepID=A0ABT1I8Z6_9PSEU|nr:carbon storage regulator, CsrA [Actinokineospora diospyrosa]